MNAHRAQVRAALAALRLHPTGYSWFGRPSQVLPRAAARALPAATARGYLISAIHTRLYTDFFCTGGPVPADELRPGAGDTRPRHPYLDALSAANTGAGCAEGPWRVHAVDGPHTVVERRGLRIWLAPDEVCPVAGDRVAPGATVAIRLPKELRERSPGFYVALGDEALPPVGAELLVRVYWNLTAPAAPPAVRLVTSALNAARIPFQFKVANSPHRFNRCDAGVLYVPSRRYPEVCDVLATAHTQLGGALAPGTPVFTKRLAPGLGLAEDPGDGDSFGMHRCRLLAEGVVAARQRGRATDDQRLATIEEHLRAAGIDLDAPYLNPGSRDDYPALATTSPHQGGH